MLREIQCQTKSNKAHYVAPSVQSESHEDLLKFLSPFLFSLGLQFAFPSVYSPRFPSRSQSTTTSPLFKKLPCRPLTNVSDDRPATRAITAIVRNTLTQRPTRLYCKNFGSDMLSRCSDTFTCNRFSIFIRLQIHSSIYFILFNKNTALLKR